VIADPYRYRLPRATGPNRWVRYGNDVLLVNGRTGRVVTVYNSFFY
jgi:Ni/Co efflux regulator RcnB